MENRGVAARPRRQAGGEVTLTARGRSWANAALILAFLASFAIGLFSDWSLA